MPDIANKKIRLFDTGAAAQIVLVRFLLMISALAIGKTIQSLSKKSLLFSDSAIKEGYIKVLREDDSVFDQVLKQLRVSLESERKFSTEQIQTLHNRFLVSKRLIQRQCENEEIFNIARGKISFMINMELKSDTKADLYTVLLMKPLNLLLYLMILIKKVFDQLISKLIGEQNSFSQSDSSYINASLTPTHSHRLNSSVFRG